MKIESLDIEELKKGIFLAIENAEELIKEGDLLFANQFYARAYTLYQLGAEEIGKSNLLFSLIMDLKLHKKINSKELNRAFIDHKIKSKKASTNEKIAYLLMFSHAEGSAQERREKFVNTIEELDKESTSDLNDNKNNSLYVSIQNGKFEMPKSLISKEMSANLRTNTVIRFETGKSLNKFLLEDIDRLVAGLKTLEENGRNIIDDSFFDPFFKE